MSGVFGTRANEAHGGPATGTRLGAALGEIRWAYFVSNTPNQGSLIMSSEYSESEVCISLSCPLN